MSEYIAIDCSGTFLKNAGIVGLMRFLKYNKARENTDYIVENQELRVSIDYLRDNDIAQMYFDTVTDMFEEQTKFYRVVYQDRAIIESLVSKGIDTLNKDEIKKLTELFKAFEDELLKKSYMKVFELIKTGELSDITLGEVSAIKKEKDLNLKYQIYSELIKKVTVKEVKRQFIYTTLLFGDFRYFFVENKSSHIISALDANDKSRRDIIYDNFFSSIFEDISAEEKKKKTRCIECMQKTSQPRDNTFMVDTADDVKRKKSYYWNMSSDAVICPVCAMLYLFVPLGFAFLGRTAVFINMNSSVEMMYKIMETYRSKADDDDNATYYQRIYKIFTDEKIQILSERLSNIQIVFRDTNSEHYNMKIIDKPIIKKLQKANKSGNLSSLEKVYLVNTSGKEWIYNSVFDSILSYKSLYGIIDKCLRYEFNSDSKRYGYILRILKTEIIFNGGSEVDNLMKEVNWAFETGKQMRKAILGDNSFSDKNEDDNSIRSFVYRLINLSSVGDVAQFMDTVLRQYSGYGLTIPAVFKNCYKSEEDFKAIAHGYILGLKYCRSNGENDNNDKGDNSNE